MNKKKIPFFCAMTIHRNAFVRSFSVPRDTSGDRHDVVNTLMCVKCGFTKNVVDGSMGGITSIFTTIK